MDGKSDLNRHKNRYGLSQKRPGREAPQRGRAQRLLARPYF
jgi:hypothetical protein